jgi:hypothetical protein
MRRSFVIMIVLCCTLSVSLVEICFASSRTRTPKHRAWSSERRLLVALGLPPDANDEEVVELLNEPGKRPLAIGVIRYRKIISASGALLQIVNDEATGLPIRIKAAHALCDFGNKEWIKPLKALVTDPNSKVYFSLKISTAGLLARAGDYSQFGILAKYIHHPKRYVRSAVVRALGNFRAKGREEVRSAAELLASVATSDPQPWVRRCSIESLEKIVQQRSDLAPKLMDAAEANLDSDDTGLKIRCRTVLRGLKKPVHNP